MFVPVSKGQRVPVHLAVKMSLLQGHEDEYAAGACFALELTEPQGIITVPQTIQKISHCTEHTRQAMSSSNISTHLKTATILSTHKQYCVNMSYCKKLGGSEKHNIQNVIQHTDKKLESINKETG
jgi:hypothetical protein